MSTALTIVRLRWALTWAALRKSVWQTIGYIFTLLIAICAVISFGVLAVFLGGGPVEAGLGSGPAAAQFFASATRIGVVLAVSFGVILVLVVQLMMGGESSTLSLNKFALYGIPDRKLQGGLLAAGLTGTPAIATLVGFLLWALAYRWMGPAPVIAALVAAPLAVVTFISLCKLILALSTTLVKSTRGRNAFYVIVIVAFVLLAQVPNLILNTGTTGDRDFADVFTGLMASADRAADVLAFTPLAAAAQLPFDAAAGAWGWFALRVAILAVTWVVCFMGSTWCLRHERLTVGASTAASRIKGIGAFAHVPDSPSGAISARFLSYLKRDPRQSIGVVFPLVFVVLFAIQSHGISAVVWQSLVWIPLFMVMVEGNALAYDGGGFTMQILAGTPGKADRLGRVRVMGLYSVAYLVILAIGIFAFTGDWRTASGLGLGLTMLMLGIGMTGAALGLAEIVNGVLMYPVASIDKPFSTPQGRMAAQGLFPFVHMFGSFLVLLPTGLVALIVGLTAGLDVLVWVVGPVALLNGAVALAVGVIVGGRILDIRATKIVATLDSFASLQK